MVDTVTHLLHHIDNNKRGNIYKKKNISRIKYFLLYYQIKYFNVLSLYYSNEGQAIKH